MNSYEEEKHVYQDKLKGQLNKREKEKRKRKDRFKQLY